MTEVQITIDSEKEGIDPDKLKDLVEFICRRFSLNDVFVDLAVLSDKEIRRLNKRFLNRTDSTDCLSFDLTEGNSSVRSFQIIVNADRASKEANSRGHAIQAELALYITHGILHNLGYDDSSDELAEKMHRQEDEILRQFGFGPVYSSDS